MSLRRKAMKSLALSLFLAAGSTAAGSPDGGAAVRPPYVAEVEAWRTAREARLRAPDGWLSIVGLTWLHQGENRFGSAADDDVVLPGVTPPHAGSFVLEGRAVRLEIPAGSPVTLNGKPATSRALRTDVSATPDVLAVGAVSWQLIERGGRIGVRVSDREKPLRTNWLGTRWFAIDPAYRVIAHLEERPGEMVVPDASGGKQRLKSPGTLTFSLGGRPQRLDPVLDGDDDGDQLIVFRDATSGRETYGGGRFVRARRQPDGTFVLDFNRAYAPPCAFTPYATCPLPPAQNRLHVAIPAGERNLGEGGRNARR
jgi:uncharacterized protein (DUF1684 family)